MAPADSSADPTGPERRSQTASQTDAAVGGRRARRHARARVVAPPTNPGADQTDEAPSPNRRGRGGPEAQDDGAPVRLDPRDAWILEERPPHWD